MSEFGPSLPNITSQADASQTRHLRSDLSATWTREVGKAVPHSAFQGFARLLHKAITPRTRRTLEDEEKISIIVPTGLAQASVLDFAPKSSFLSAMTDLIISALVLMSYELFETAAWWFNRPRTEAIFPLQSLSRRPNLSYFGMLLSDG
jgi:hypothetical protein